MLPASAWMFLAAVVGLPCPSVFRPAASSGRARDRAGLGADDAATIDIELDSASFLTAMGVLGVGMGLVISQLGNVVQSSVGDEDRSEAGGLQNTSQQLGSSLGTALLGAVVITGLLAAFSGNVADNPEISASVKDQVEVELSSGGSFVSSDQVRAAAGQEGLSSATTDNLVADYEDAQLGQALKLAFLIAALLVLASLPPTRRLPDYPLARSPDAAEATAVA